MWPSGRVRDHKSSHQEEQEALHADREVLPLLRAAHIEHITRK